MADTIGLYNIEHIRAPLNNVEPGDVVLHEAVPTQEFTSSFVSNMAGQARKEKL
jgi:hypothetical protein